MHGNTGGRPDIQAHGWAQRLGEERHATDESAARTSKSRETEAERQTSAAIERWPAIIVKMRGLADAYNAGARRVVLSVVEQSGPPTVTVVTGGEGTPFLTAALEDTLICIDGRDASGMARATEIRLRSDRDDDATAAYVLRDWMERL
jgi:hypothetical protein